jgi:hypothetical protein
MYLEDVVQKLEELIKKFNFLLDSYKNDAKSQGEWLDKEETMRIFKCSERTLQYLRDSGLLSYSKPFGGSKFFYRRKDVLALFEKNFNGKI